MRLSFVFNFGVFLYIFILFPEKDNHIYRFWFRTISCLLLLLPMTLFSRKTVDVDTWLRYSFFLHFARLICLNHNAIKLENVSKWIPTVHSCGHTEKKRRLYPCNLVDFCYDMHVTTLNWVIFFRIRMEAMVWMTF